MADVPDNAPERKFLKLTKNCDFFIYMSAVVVHHLALCGTASVQGRVMFETNVSVAVDYTNNTWNIPVLLQVFFLRPVLLNR